MSLQTTPSGVYFLAEHVLQESQSYVSSILACITDVLFVADPTGSIQLVNQAACALLGCHEQDLLGRSLPELLAENSILAPQELESLNSQGSLQNLKKHLHNSQGQIIPVSVNCAIWRGKQDQILGFICIVRDLRERIQTATALYQSEARNLAFLRAIPDLVLRLSRTGVFLDIVPARGFEYINLALIGRNITELLPADLAEQYLRLIQQALDTGTIQVWEYTLTLTGSIRCQEVRIAICGEDEVLAIVRDVTDRKQIEATLKRYQLLSQHTRDIVLFLRPDGSILEANDAATGAYEYTHQELLRMRFHDLYDPAAATTLDEQLLQANQHGQLFEAIHYRKDGSRFPVEVSVQGALISDEPLLLTIVRDTTNRKRTEERLFHSAFHDALTNLPNRVLFLEKLRRALQHKEQQSNYPFAVLFLDLDGFKVINDSLGHLAGDQLLEAISQRLLTCLKPSDTLARFGGDEFAILLEGPGSHEQATATAEQIQQTLSQPFPLRGQSVYTATSIGIVLSSIGAANPEDLLRNADTALYRAKALGGTRYAVFDTEMHNRALMRLRTETDLRRALADSIEQIPHPEFLVYYQPIVSLKTLRIRGFEALVRWKHPDRGLIPPNEFIPIAEETGLIEQLGWIVLRQACHQLRLWQTQFPQHANLSMSVNLSVKQFAQPTLVAQIRQVLEETGVVPQALKLEITESAIMENPDVATYMMRDLQQMGVQFSLDDFGTGYSSLAYLHRFPVDVIKVDRSFIQRIDVFGEQLEIVRAITMLAWNLGIDIVAEGVETNKQLTQLRALRCEYGQGYFFSKPVPAADAIALLKAETVTESGL